MWILCLSVFACPCLLCICMPTRKTTLQQTHNLFLSRTWPHPCQPGAATWAYKPLATALDTHSSSIDRWYKGISRSKHHAGSTRRAHRVFVVKRHTEQRRNHLWLLLTTVPHSDQTRTYTAAVSTACAGGRMAHPRRVRDGGRSWHGEICEQLYAYSWYIDGSAVDNGQLADWCCVGHRVHSWVVLANHIVFRISAF